MIDPISALAGIQSAVKLVKKMSATVDDVASLGPVLGKYFDAKSAATKAMVQSKKKGGSNMGSAIQIEMALEQAKDFENELQMLFMQAGKVDVWNNIKLRALQMDKADAIAAREEREEAARKKAEMDELIEIIFYCCFALMILGLAIWGAFELVDYCKQNVCGRS
jgi:hypothetical protein